MQIIILRQNGMSQGLMFGDHCALVYFLFHQFKKKCVYSFLFFVYERRRENPVLFGLLVSPFITKLLIRL